MRNGRVRCSYKVASIYKVVHRRQMVWPHATLQLDEATRIT